MGCCAFFCFACRALVLSPVGNQNLLRLPPGSAAFTPLHAPKRWGLKMFHLTRRARILKRRKRRAPSGWRQALTNLTVVLRLFIGGLQGLQAAASNALADYVARPDDSFAWKEVGQKQADDITDRKSTRLNSSHGYISY